MGHYKLDFEGPIRDEPYFVRVHSWLSTIDPPSDGGHITVAPKQRNIHLLPPQEEQLSEKFSSDASTFWIRVSLSNNKVQSAPSERGQTGIPEREDLIQLLG